MYVFLEIRGQSANTTCKSVQSCPRGDRSSFQYHNTAFVNKINNGRFRKAAKKNSPLNGWAIKRGGGGKGPGH